MSEEEKESESLGDKAKAAAEKLKASAENLNAGEKAKSFAGKAKEAIKKLPFNNLAQKVPALAKFAGYANYAACVLALLLVVVILTATGHNKSGSSDHAKLKSVEANVKKELGVSAEELIAAYDALLGKDYKIVNASTEDVADAIAQYAVTSDSQKAMRLEVIFENVLSNLSKDELTRVMDKAKRLTKGASKEISRKKAELVKFVKDSDANDSVAKVDNFYIMKTEVMQGLYKAVTGTNPSEFKGDDFRPVECINWYEAVEFCNLLSEKQGLKSCYSVNGSTNTASWGEGGEDYRDYDVELIEGANGWRLPTDEEWKKAADDGHKYSGSDELDEVAWYKGNSEDHPHKVATKNPNANGIYDMSGNVYEWCWDNAGNDGKNPRIVKGGAWDTSSKIGRYFLGSLVSSEINVELLIDNYVYFTKTGNLAKKNNLGIRLVRSAK